MDDEPLDERSPSPAARAERVVFVALGVFLATALAGVGFFAVGATSFGSATYAKVFATPSGSWRSLRIQVVAQDADAPSSETDSVLLFVGDMRVDVPLDDAGFAEVALAEPVAGPLRVSVERGGAVLVSGTIGTEGASREWSISPTVSPLRDDLGSSLSIERGSLVASLPGRVRFVARRAAPQGLVVSGVGVTPLKKDAIAAGEAVFIELTARDQFVDLELESGQGKDSGHAVFRVPARLAGMVVERFPEDEIRVTSPSPRNSAHVSLHRDGARVGGARVVLAESPDGFFRGAVKLHGASAEGAVAVVSSDPDEGASGTLAWPLGDPWAEARGPLLAKVLDGRGSVESARARVLARYKLGAGIAVAMSILGMAVSILMLARRAHDEGSAQLEGPSEVSASRSRRLLFGTASLVIAVLLLLGMTVLWVAFHLFGSSRAL